MTRFPDYFSQESICLQDFNQALIDASLFINSERPPAELLIKKVRKFWRANESLLRYSSPPLDFPPFNIEGRLSKLRRRLGAQKKWRCWKRRPIVAVNIAEFYSTLNSQLPDSKKARSLLQRILRAADFVGGLPPESSQWDLAGVGLSQKNLPPELLEKIFAHLSLTELGKVSQVCRLFHLHLPRLVVKKINSQSGLPSLSSRWPQQWLNLASLLRVLGPEFQNLRCLELKSSSKQVHLSKREQSGGQPSSYYWLSIQSQALLEDKECEGWSITLDSPHTLLLLPSSWGGLSIDGWVEIYQDSLIRTRKKLRGSYPGITKLVVRGNEFDYYSEVNQFIQLIFSRFPNLAHLQVRAMKGLHFTELPSSLRELHLIGVRAEFEPGLIEALEGFTQQRA